MTTQRNLYGLDRGQLESLFQEMGLQAFRGRQIMKWSTQGITDFAAMTDLPLKARQWLQEHCCLGLLGIHERFLSKDGTVKWLLHVAAGDLVEMVLIPDKGRNTLCVSSQVGCVLTAVFVYRQGFSRTSHPLKSLARWPLRTPIWQKNRDRHQCRSHGHGRAIVEL